MRSAGIVAQPWGGPQVLFTYNDNVRSAMVMNRGVLIETALINGSWQAVHAILTHCSNLMKREDLLAELMIPLLTSEVPSSPVSPVPNSCAQSLCPTPVPNS